MGSCFGQKRTANGDRNGGEEEGESVAKKQEVNAIWAVGLGQAVRANKL